MGKFRELHVWQRSKDLSVYIYNVTGNQHYRNDRGLQDQMRRASVSIPSNIAEGDESGSENQSIRYFNISKGSSAELLTQTIISFEIGYISAEVSEYIINECDVISRMLCKLIESRKHSA